MVASINIMGVAMNEQKYIVTGKARIFNNNKIICDTSISSTVKASSAQDAIDTVKQNIANEITIYNEFEVLEISAKKITTTKQLSML